MSSTRHSQYGFNLLELIITLAIAAILIAIAVPSMMSFIGDSEMSSTTNEFVYSLQTARSEAIKRAGPVGVCPSLSSQADSPTCSESSYASGWIVFFDANGNGSRDGTEDVILQAEKRSVTFTFTADTVFAQRVYFGSTGTSTNLTGVPLSGEILIDFSGGEEKRTVKVAANGRITTLTPDGTN